MSYIRWTSGRNATRQPGTVHPSDSKYKIQSFHFPENIIRHLLPQFGNFQHLSLNNTQISHVITPLNLQHDCQQAPPHRGVHPRDSSAPRHVPNRSIWHARPKIPCSLPTPRPPGFHRNPLHNPLHLRPLHRIPRRAHRQCRSQNLKDNQ